VRHFALQGFELFNGRHVARLRATSADERPEGSPRRSALWTRAEDARADLVGALALPHNKRVLFTLAGVPDDSTVEWAVRDVGAANNMDLVALVSRASGGRALLMVTCTPVQTTPAKLREQLAQSVRSALATLASVELTDRATWTQLVVLAGWRRGVPIPTEAKPLPALQRAADILEPVPEPKVWGVVTYAYESRPDAVYVSFGRWSDFEGAPWNALGNERVAVSWASWPPVPIPSFGEADVELEEHGGRVRVSLRLRSTAHKASMKLDRHANHLIRRIRALRSACYAGHAEVGSGRFVGETLEGGTPRLHWEWAEGHAPSPDAARDAVVAMLETFVKPPA
jgi:hypothetical protein